MLPFNVWAQSLWETLYMVIVSTVISYALGLPLGLTLVVTDKGGIRPMPIVNTVLGVVVNILRSVPFLILAVMITPITRAIVGKAIGTTAMIVPLTFAAAPYVARMVESSIKEVPFGVIEAAQSMGASPWQIVWKVLVPEAKPSLMVGGAISVVTILGYSAMAGFIGGGGLGTVAVNYGYNRYNFPIMLVAVIIIVIVVQIFQEVAAAGDDKTITVGATPTPHAEILNAAKDALEAEGYTLKVVEFTDYVQPNTALVDGDLDANYFQHTPYLNNFNKENGTDLAAAFDMHYEPFGIYAGKTASIEELKDGASIAIPNDGSNETRALLLLQDAGLIKLKDGIDPTSDATKLDITENPKNLDIQEIAAEQLPRSLADVDLAVINGNYALQADLNAAEDSLITENPDYAKVYVNVVACRSGEENSDKIQALKKALQSDDVKKYVDETYKGAVVTVF